MNKEIKEMAEVIENCNDDRYMNYCHYLASNLYHAGYRKQSDTVNEFAESLKLKLTDPSGWVTHKCQDLCWYIDKLAEQYGREE